MNSIDTALILQYAAGFTTKTCPAADGDVNRDGDLSPVDAALILQYEAGLIDGFVPGVVRVCHPSYPTVCIPGAPTYLGCEDIEVFNFEVVGDHPHGFDPDRNGFSCERISIVP